MTYKTLIFDLDGTLLDTAPDVHKCANLARAEMGLAAISLEQAKKGIGPGPDNFARYTFGEGNPKQAEHFIKLFRKHYDDHLLDNTRPFPGILDLLTGLQNFSLVVATNKPKKYSCQVLEANGILSFFSFVIGPEDVEHNKPFPDMVLKAMTLTGSAPATTLMIGDTDNDAKSAKAARIAFCAVSWGYAPVEILKTDNPEYVINDPLDLLKIVHGDD